jgi:hypothetical protein
MRRAQLGAEDVVESFGLVLCDVALHEAVQVDLEVIAKFEQRRLENTKIIDTGPSSTNQIVVS